MSTYYERNRDKIKENRRKRYEQKKQKQNNVILSVAKDLPELRSTGVTLKERGSFADAQDDGRLMAQVILGTIVLFSVFLIWQGAVFFMKQGYFIEEAWTVSVFGELLLIVSSGLVFYAETKRTKQVFTLICSLSIVLLGAFLHNGVRKSLIETTRKLQNKTKRNPEQNRNKTEHSYKIFRKTLCF